MDKKIKIGFPVPLSSVYGVEALDQARSAQIAVDEFNESGGLDGRMAELLIRDTKHSPDLARDTTIDLIEKDKVDFVAGALSALDMVLIGKTCSERKIVYNGLSVGDGVVSKETRTPYIFHEGPTAFGIADIIGRYAFSHFGFRVATLSADHPFGRDSVRGLHNVGYAIGVDFVTDEYHAMGEKEWGPYLERIAALKPEVLVSTNFGSDQVNMLTKIKEMGLEKEMRIVCTNLSIIQRQRMGSDLYEGVVGGSGYYWAIESAFESARSFNSRYKKNHGFYPAAHGSYAYGGVKSLLSAARVMKSVKSEDLIEGMLSLRFDYCRGPQFYRHLDHQSVQPVIIMESKSESDMSDQEDLFKVLAIADFVGPRAFHISYDKV